MLADQKRLKIIWKNWKIKLLFLNNIKNYTSGVFLLFKLFIVIRRGTERGLSYFEKEQDFILSTPQPHNATKVKVGYSFNLTKYSSMFCLGVLFGASDINQQFNTTNFRYVFMLHGGSKPSPQLSLSHDRFLALLILQTQLFWLLKLGINSWSKI